MKMTPSAAGSRRARTAAVVIALSFGLVLALLRLGGVIGGSAPATPGAPAGSAEQRVPTPPDPSR
ncbi:hypothetical protein [Phycisphaera mikurensis]|uniref:hypothetical protein n=1 Tax=Phycisphaera mikurensis TaxID=547188 RepID=UPI00059C1F5E|nr:hypothetical protein [Phycisphaera mikurensis]MBB6442337.1 hypothetical protein [Phycisphaera mikurensis]